MGNVRVAGGERRKCVKVRRTADNEEIKQAKAEMTLEILVTLIF